ncbi:MAG: L-serine ammonia-lyase [Gammaproteobacteria bacterium]|jgi:L-serine dehydratase|nr:L-serine ammonia-lyase [Gammaproteobacteria bacterium]NCF59249.1 L-serine ammonia-lyase [Gammaproteobacteria bacterium]
MAAISIFDIFKIGVGPSSSHTVGPMKAANAFASELAALGAAVSTLEVTLHGSLAYTGKGHGTDSAVLLGLAGSQPETIDPESMEEQLRRIHGEKRIEVPGIGMIDFDPQEHLVFNYDEELPRHTNGMRFRALGPNAEVVRDDIYYSLGGGFIARGDEPEPTSQSGEPRHYFDNSHSLLQLCADHGCSIAELVLENEVQWRDRAEVDRSIDAIWRAMEGCIERGLRTEGVLPGAMAVTRRAPKLRSRLEAREQASPLDAMEWVNAYAIAVNEENAAGGRVVTSPTNGAAGIIPAVLMYYLRFVPGANTGGVRTFLLTAGAIGILYKVNASISGAEMGCQGEVGVACSMAAGALAAVLGGTSDHVEEAAEIGMEHNLGLTCDPIGGLVQIPCIERNAMGAVKAINAATIAMHGDGTHKVTLDQVIETMRQTGLDMSSSYKETSMGGLAVNVPEC